MEQKINDPLADPTPEEVHLPESPLARVVSQVRFTDVLSIPNQEFIANFQENIRSDYPVTDRQEAQTIQIGPGGVQVTQAAEVVWRLRSADNKWRASLAKDFVALETQSYLSRTDFVQRFSRLLESVFQDINPTHVTRVGIRYINRLSGDNIDGIQKMLTSDMLGLTPKLMGDNLEYTMSDAVCQTKEGTLGIKWGFLSPQSTHEPNLLPPVEGRSWVLDLDVSREFTVGQFGFDPHDISELVKSLASRAHTFFRWAVTPEFLKAHGGKL